MEECGNDLDAAIKRLRDLCLQPTDENVAPAEDQGAAAERGILFYSCLRHLLQISRVSLFILFLHGCCTMPDVKGLYYDIAPSIFQNFMVSEMLNSDSVRHEPPLMLIYSYCYKSKNFTTACKLAGINNGDVPVSEVPSAPQNLPVDGEEWVNLFVSEMMNATSPDDARARAARVLDIFQKSINASNGAEAAQTLQKVNILLAKYHPVFAQLLHFECFDHFDI